MPRFLVSLAVFADLPDTLFYAAAPIMAAGVWLLASEQHVHALSHRHTHEEARQQ